MQNLIKIKTESKIMNVSLRMFDRLLHLGKIHYCPINNMWAFV